MIAFPRLAAAHAQVRRQYGHLPPVGVTQSGAAEDVVNAALQRVAAHRGEPIDAEVLAANLALVEALAGEEKTAVAASVAPFLRDNPPPPEAWLRGVAGVRESAARQHWHNVASPDPTWNQLDSAVFSWWCGAASFDGVRGRCPPKDWLAWSRDRGVAALFRAMAQAQLMDDFYWRDVSTDCIRHWHREGVLTGVVAAGAIASVRKVAARLLSNCARTVNDGEMRSAYAEIRREWDRLDPGRPAKSSSSGLTELEERNVAHAEALISFDVLAAECADWAGIRGAFWRREQEYLSAGGFLPTLSASKTRIVFKNELLQRCIVEYRIMGPVSMFTATDEFYGWPSMTIMAAAVSEKSDSWFKKNTSARVKVNHVGWDWEDATRRALRQFVEGGKR